MRQNVINIDFNKYIQINKFVTILSFQHQIFHNINQSFFLLTSTTRMITSILSRSLLGSIFSPCVNRLFCTYHNSGSRYESNPLRNKIMDLVSLEQFHNFTKDRQGEFDNACYSLAARTLAKILIESRMNYNNYQKDMIKQYLTQLQNVNIQTLTLSQFSQLLFLLRTIKMDQNNNNSWIFSYIKNIIQRSQKKIKQIQQQCPLNKLVYFYQQFCGLNSKHSSAIAKRINEIIKKNQPETETITLSVTEIIVILKGMKYKYQYNFEELILLRSMIKLVNQKYNSNLNISFVEVVQISCSVNQIISKTPNDIIQLKDVEELHKRVLNNIEDMDQKSIMFILNSKKTNNKIYNQIYKIIFDKIFDQIQPNGDSAFNQLFTFKLFNGICNKVKLASTSQQNQQKFFAFLISTVTKTPRYANNFVQNFVENNFLNYAHLKRLVEILQKLKMQNFQFKLTLLAELGRRKLNIEKLINFDIDSVPEVRDKNLILVGEIIQAVIDKKSQKQQVFQQMLTKVKERFLSLYNMEDQSFVKLLYTLQAKYFHGLIKVFRKQIQTKFPNPFETQQNDKYRYAYLKMMVLGDTDSYFVKKTLYSITNSLKKQDIDFILRYFNNNRDNNLRDFYPNILNLLCRKIDLILKDNVSLNHTQKFLTSELLKIFEQYSNDVPKNKFWTILNQAQQKLPQKQFISTFSNVIYILLRSNIYNFSYSQQYKSLMKKLLKNLDILNKNFSNSIVRECLKLSLIRRQSLELISPKIRQGLNREDLLLLQMIQKNQFILKNIQLARNNLYLFLFNNSFDTKEFLRKNIQKITSLIEQMKPKELLRCILYYRSGSLRQQITILDAIFKQLNTNKYLNYQQYCPILVAQVLRRNNIEKHIHLAQNIKIFLKNTLQYFSQKSKLHKLNLQQHIQLARSLNDFRFKNDQYMHNLIQRYQSENNIFYRQLFLLCGQLGVELNSTQMNRLENRSFFVNYTASFSKCFHLFLLFEDKLTNAKESLQMIIKKYKQISQNQKVQLYSIYYEYLKNVYPQQTKQFIPNNIVNADFCKNIESINNNKLLLLRQLFQQVYDDKFVEHVIHDNYYYTFRNVNICFPAVSKFYGENNMMKKLLTRLTGLDKFLIVNKNQASLYNIVKFIKTNNPDLVTAQYEEKLMKKIEELKNNKAELTEEESTQEVLNEKKE